MLLLEHKNKRFLIEYDEYFVLRERGVDEALICERLNPKQMIFLFLFRFDGNVENTKSLINKIRSC